MKRALALSGGGAKGAYELGAWEALEQLGQSFDIVTGTSIGAFNGAFVVQRDLEGAVKMWENITLGQVVQGLDMNELTMEQIRGARENMLPVLRSYIAGKGMDITPLIHMMEEVFRAEDFFRSPIDFGVMTVRFPSMAPVEMTKSRMKREDFRRWVLASASCFPAFPMCTIGKHAYIDGGYYDNLPIGTAFRMGADEVVAIDLHPEPVHPEYMDHPLVHTVLPGEPLGSFTELVPEHVRRIRTLGYLDTLRSFGKYVGKTYTLRREDHPVDRVFARLATQTGLPELTNATAAVRFHPKNQIFSTLRSFGEIRSVQACRAAAAEMAAEAMGLDRAAVYDTDDILRRLVPWIENEHRFVKIRRALRAGGRIPVSTDTGDLILCLLAESACEISEKGRRA